MTPSPSAEPLRAQTPRMPMPARTDAPTGEQLLDAARALGPLIREHADATERDRRLAAPVAEAIARAGFQSMLTPRSLGGLEVDPVSCARVAEELASHDSAAGWSLQIGNTGAWWCARFPDEGVEELFADGPFVRMAAAFHPPHRAVPVPGGYRFSGRGPLASNVHDSEWLMMTGFIMDGDGPKMTDGLPSIVAVAMRTREVEIIDSWHSLGMRGTDSNDVAATDVFVPTSRSFVFSPEMRRSRYFDGPLYALPAVASVGVIVPPVALAIARGAIDALRELAARKMPFGSMKTMLERTAVQSAIGEAEGMLRSARLLFYETLAESWRRTAAGDGNTLEQKAELLLAGAHAVKSASRVADLMHRHGGTSGIYQRSRLERLFRDAQTVRHHGFFNESRLEAVGQVLLGVQPEFALVAL